MSFTRSSFETTVVNLFLTNLRTYLSDPITPARTNTNWIRSSLMVKNDSTPTTDTDLTRKRWLTKESNKPGMPQVVVGNVTLDSSQKTINLGTNPNYESEAELTIRIVDIGDISRIGNLTSQIDSLLETYRGTFMTSGVSNMSWAILSDVGGPESESEYRESQIVVRFKSRFSSWLV